MVSSGLLLKRAIEPVVNLLVPQPATLAASAIMNAVVISRFPVAFIIRLVGINIGLYPCARPLRSRLPTQRNILLTLTDS
ncbi:hypothetical protein MESS2_1030050 [Mesorhizobium metallidurans STM 2683]|uniref:Uncharacterized protein n=1 Tax=Mesorhizobium metallidurans STM 2683 TaxID=1297569 RepID=M5EG91_9HYPH|nr:hypothetical protein MESS2_1030050 [Mesorhizobium metallidurans STM 2683]